MSQEQFQRYGIIEDKNPREIVLLRGSGCRWRRCRFCDYHLDYSKDAKENYGLNRQVLAQVTGRFGRLEVINSGSFVDLDEDTLAAIEALCGTLGIAHLHFECHWQDRQGIAALRQRFGAIHVAVHLKIGVETFDSLFRESYLCKGIEETDPAKIAAFFDEVCLLQGLPGQSVEAMVEDIETGLAHFQRVCVNIMEENSAPIVPDPRVIQKFVEQVLPRYRDNPRVDILLHNTDFGVGGCGNDQ